MARTANVQFTPFTQESARRFLESCPQTSDMVGDRIAAHQALVPVTSEQERLRLRTYLLSEGYVIFPWRFPDGDWPYAKTPAEQVKRSDKTEFEEWLDGVISPIPLENTGLPNSPQCTQTEKPENRKVLPW